MDVSTLIFAALNINQDEIQDKRVVEVGAYDVNGSLKPLIKALNPKEYIGTDIIKGPGVDFVCDANELLERFSESSFDFVISTEVIEHVKDWRLVVHNIKNICKPGGKILVTTRTPGFFYHGHPCDYWRYDLEDLKFIFQDFSVERIEKDSQFGVMIKALKPKNFTEVELQDYMLYSIIARKKITNYSDINLKLLRHAAIAFSEKLRKMLYQIAHALRWR